MPTISFSLNSKDIDRAIREVQQYAEKVKALQAMLVKRLTKDGVEVAKDMASFMSIYDTGMLVGAIRGETDGDIGYIVSAAPYSAFVEFGTGVVGKDNPHPEPPAGWVYDVNQHGEEGWVYYDERYGRFFWTKGMPSRPFMYETGKELREIAPEVAKELMQGKGGG